MTNPVESTHLLATHLRNGAYGAFIRDSLQHCRFERQWLPTVWLTLVRSHSTAASAQALKRLALADLAKTRHVAHDDVAATYALRPGVLERTFDAQGDAVLEAIATATGVSERGVGALRYAAANNDLCTETAVPTMRRTFPFAHPPLNHFVAGAPPAILWGAGNHRAFVSAALRDVLPQTIIDRRDKGRAGSHQCRTLMSSAMECLQDVEGMRLVTSGLADPTTLRELLAAFLDGSQDSQSIVSRLIGVEALLRHSSLKGGPQRRPLVADLAH